MPLMPSRKARNRSDTGSAGATAAHVMPGAPRTTSSTPRRHPCSPASQSQRCVINPNAHRVDEPPRPPQRPMVAAPGPAERSDEVFGTRPARMKLLSCVASRLGSCFLSSSAVVLFLRLANQVTSPASNPASEPAEATTRVVRME